MEKHFSVLLSPGYLHHNKELYLAPKKATENFGFFDATSWPVLKVQGHLLAAPRDMADLGPCDLREKELRPINVIEWI